MDMNGIENYNIALDRNVVDDKSQVNATIRKNKVGIKIENIVKRVVDIGGGLIGTIALIPLTIIIYIARIVLHENDGPIFYDQLRIGKNGKVFKMYKYRSMVIGADEKLKKYLEENEEARLEYKKYKKLKNDPRITKVGNFIRKTSLDEFPQFINVLKGDMSLVGPRPYLPREKEDMGEYYTYIINARPGITGYCEKICPIINVPEVSTSTETYAAQNKEKNVRQQSTSGGMFFEFAKKIIKDGGYVCGAGYSNEGRVCHKIVNKIEELYDLMGSKYVQSDLSDCFLRIEKLLNNKNKVLFIGTPCQCAGLKKIAQKNIDNLYLIDLICYGVPSPLIYDKWINYMEAIYKKKIRRISFRDKTYGYAAPNVKVYFEDDTFKEQTIPIKTYMKLFMNNISIRPACTDCRFKGIERTTDITLGDCWSIGKFEKEMDDNLGTTGVYIHTEKGMKLFTEIKENINVIQIDSNLAVKYDGKKMINSAPKNSVRENFFKKLNDTGYIESIDKYAHITVKEKIITLIKRILNKSTVFNTFLKWYRNK